MVALGEKLHGLGRSQRRAQQPLPVRVLAELPQDAGVGGLQRRQVGLVLFFFAGRLMLGVYDEAAEAVVAVEVLHGVNDFSVAVAVHVESLRGSGGRLMDDREVLEFLSSPAGLADSRSACVIKAGLPTCASPPHTLHTHTHPPSSIDHVN